MLCPDRIDHQGYEELTKDFESNSRVLTEKLGLYWDSAILRPHENPRAVRTASQNQVKSPVYENSSLDWLKFQPYLNGKLDSICRLKIGVGNCFPA